MEFDALPARAVVLVVGVFGGLGAALLAVGISEHSRELIWVGEAFAGTALASVLLLIVRLGRRSFAYALTVVNGVPRVVLLAVATLVVSVGVLAFHDHRSWKRALQACRHAGRIAPLDARSAALVDARALLSNAWLPTDRLLDVHATSLCQEAEMELQRDRTNLLHGVCPRRPTRATPCVCGNISWPEGVTPAMRSCEDNGGTPVCEQDHGLHCAME